MDEQRLKLAGYQKSGRLTDRRWTPGSRCGLSSAGQGSAHWVRRELPLDVLFVRDDDIPDLVQEDVCDLGLVGPQRNWKRSAWTSPSTRNSRPALQASNLDFRALQARACGLPPQDFPSRARPPAGAPDRHDLSFLLDATCG